MTPLATFLPLETFEQIDSESSSNGRYINPSKLEQGKEYRLRFVRPGITGFGGWTVEKKPIRFEFHPEALPPNLAPDLGGKVQLKRFIAGLVYDYTAEDFKILEITQRTLMEQLYKYAKDSDYGDPLGYDIKLTREGEKMDTKYTLVAAPPKPLEKAIAEKAAEVVCNLQALYDGTDPFADPKA